MNIKKSFINPVKKPVPTTIPLRKVVARKGNKTGYLYYEDDILKRERDIYGEKNFVESFAIHDLIFSTPRFKCKINRIPKGSSVHVQCFQDRRTRMHRLQKAHRGNCLSQSVRLCPTESQNTMSPARVGNPKADGAEKEWKLRIQILQDKL